MSESEISFVPDEATPEFWNGWLANAVASAITNMRRLDPTSTSDGYLYSKTEVAQSLERSLDAFLDHPANADSVLRVLSDGLLWGFVVEDARGEPYALRESYTAARDARANAEDYLDGAATCGHPSAGPWVRERLPFVLRQITRAERAELLEEWGTPILDREP